MLMARWGVPLLAITFVLIYSVLGFINYTNPNIEAMMKIEKEAKDKDISLWMILGLFCLGSGLLMVCGWFLYPRVIEKMQEQKGNDIVQSPE